jgi:hypothetical protein
MTTEIRRLDGSCHSGTLLRHFAFRALGVTAVLCLTALGGGDRLGAALNGHEVDQNISADDMFQTEPTVAVQPNNPARVMAASNPIGFTSMPAWISNHYLKPGTTVLRLMPETVVLPQSETGTDGQTLQADVIADPMLAADREGTFWYGAVTRNSPTQRDCVPGGDSTRCHVVINRIAAGTTDFQPTTTAIPAADPTTAAFQDKPALAIDDWPGSPRRGTLYVAWSPLPVGGSGKFSRIVISQCQTRTGGTYNPANCDDPDNWSQPVDIAASDSSSNPFAASVTAAPNGEVYVTWVDEIANTVEINRCPPGQNCTSAATWAGGDAVVATLNFPPQNPGNPAGPKQLACPIPPEPSVSPPSPAPVVEAGPDGRVYVAFGNLRDNGTTKCTGSATDDTFDSFIAVLDPTTGVFPTVLATVSLSNDAPAANDHFLATLAVNPYTGEVESHFFSTTGDATRGTVNAYYVRSTDGGLSYSPMTTISSKRSDFRAGNAYFDHYMGSDSGASPGATDGTFYAVWIDNRSENGPGFREQELYALTPNRPPLCDANGPYVAECTGAGTNVTLNGSGSTDPDGDALAFTWAGAFMGGTASGPTPTTVFQGIGTSSVLLTVTDPFESASCSAQVSIADTIAPVVGCGVTRTSLWPPDHDLVDVGLVATAQDSCIGETPVAVDVFSNEDDDENTGDGHHSPDATNAPPRLRAERRGTGDGRVYLIRASAIDTAGNRAFACCTVVVPLKPTAEGFSTVAGRAKTAKAICDADGTSPAGFVRVGDGPVLGPKQ